MALADHFRETARPPFAGKHLIRHVREYIIGQGTRR
jgi:hypothetical protein